MNKLKLTPLSKLLITLLIVGGVAYGLYRMNKSPEIKERFSNNNQGQINTDKLPSGYKDVINMPPEE